MPLSALLFLFFASRGDLQASFLLLLPLSTCLLDFNISTMGVPDNNNLDGLERQRRELEGNVLKLQQSLYHWRTWEAEYDGLKEEISELDDDATTDEFLRIGRDFGGDLVNEEEVKVILGAKQGVTRSKEQAVNLISRRIDYVKENARTMEKRLRTAEDNLHALDSIGQVRPETTEVEFPMTEIMEELDEEGNVVSSSTQTPGSQTPELLDILKKAGVNDIPKAPQTGTESQSQQSRIEEITEDDSEADEPKEKGAPTPREPTTTSTSQQTKRTSQERQPDPPKPTPAPEPRSEPHKQRPVTDVDESPEDAELRREMLQYGIDEVGAVVAELELDETGSDASFDDSYAYDYDDDEDEDEDEFGRDTRPALSEEYHKQMRDLEEKLNARGMWNMGKDTNALSTVMKQDLDQPQMVKVDKAGDKNGKPKKKVAFAEDVDIAPPAAKPASEKKSLPPQQPEVAPMSDSVVERAESATKNPATPEPPKKVSRFKSARSGTGKSNTSASSETAVPPTNPVPGSRPPEVRSTAHKTNNTPSSPLPLFPAKPAEPKPFSQPIPDVFDLEKTTTSQTQSHPRPPSDKITADKLVERDIKEGNAAAPQLDDVDDQLHAKEIASEFYRMRNRAIQQNGGFLDDKEPEIVPLETEDAPKRVSKFKAARMK